MGFNLKLLLASTLLCLHLFVNHGFALPFGSVENGSRLVAGFFKGCPCFGPADTCFSVNRTDITDNIPCFETLHLCLAGCSLPGQAWYNDTTDSAPKSHRNFTTPAKNVSPTEIAGLIEARLVKKRLTCLEGCYSTWNVCQGDYFFEYCATNNCHLPVQPRPTRVAFKPVLAGTPKAKRGDEILDLSLEKRFTCDTLCTHNWEVCVGLVDGSPGMFEMKGCDEYIDSCTADCIANAAKRDEGISDVPLEERDSTPAVKLTGTACTTFCQQGWQICVALVDESKEMFAPSDCNKYEEGCINNCYTPVYPKPSPPKRDLAPRAAATPVNAWAEICDIHCGQGWQVCVELVNNGKLKLPLNTCDDDTQQCQANCWARKRDGGMSQSGVSLVERTAATPVNAWAEICNINCDDGWQICIALVDGSKGKFSLKGCDTYMQSCQAACWNGKRDAPRGGTVSSASIGKRDPVNPNTKGMKECQNLCNDRFIICMALVNGSEGKFGTHGCYEDIDDCSNNCKAPPTNIEPPKRRDSSMSDALLDKRDAEPLLEERQTPVCTKTAPNAIGHVCLPQWCKYGWQICVALVNGSKRMFSLDGCDTYLNNCLWTCNGYNCYKRDVILEKRVEKRD